MDEIKFAAEIRLVEYHRILPQIFSIWNFLFFSETPLSHTAPAHP